MEIRFRKPFDAGRLCLSSSWLADRFRKNFVLTAGNLRDFLTSLADRSNYFVGRYLYSKTEEIIGLSPGNWSTHKLMAVELMKPGTKAEHLVGARIEVEVGPRSVEISLFGESGTYGLPDEAEERTVALHLAKILMRNDYSTRMEKRGNATVISGTA